MAKAPTRHRKKGQPNAYWRSRTTQWQAYEQPEKRALLPQRESGCRQEARVEKLDQTYRLSRLLVIRRRGPPGPRRAHGVLDRG